MATLSRTILGKAQHKEVRSMGFGALLDIPDCTSNHDLLLALANAYEPSTYCLLTPIGKIDITWESVAAVLNLPFYGASFLEQTEAPKPFEAVKKIFEKKTSTQLIDIMNENAKGGRTFSQAYLLYALSNFLMPLSTTAVRDNIFPFIIDVNDPG
ncbi:hypothetical protein PIB30_096129, partial [Stylosanthes scabra]|nr:hypothetical protein [Stylosanthes scabra]